MILDYNTTFIISVLFLVVAFIYSSVGHAGASGYTAVMALFALSPVIMRPTSLILNIAVGLVALYKFNKAKLVPIKKVMPFLITSTPAAFFSASLTVPKEFFYILLGFFLLASGIALIFNKFKIKENSDTNQASVYTALAVGAGIGFFSGVTGTGGAIFFTPLILRYGWANTKNASGMSILFVFVNSIFALLGIAKSGQINLVGEIYIWLAAVVIGALVGSHFGINRFTDNRIQKILGLVLVIAAFKLLATSIK